jgi:hypothetical protein
LTKDDGFRQFMLGSRALGFGTRRDTTPLSETLSYFYLSACLQGNLPSIRRDDKQQWGWKMRHARLMWEERVLW